MYARGITVAVILCKYSRWNSSKFVRSIQKFGKTIAAQVAVLDFWICGSKNHNFSKDWQLTWNTRMRRDWSLDKYVFNWSCGVTVSTLDSESSDCSSNPRRTSWPVFRMSSCLSNFVWALRAWYRIALKSAPSSSYCIWSLDFQEKYLDTKLSG